jgi:hypothetical protein
MHTTVTRFALEPFLPFWGLAVLGVVLLALSFWIARRDSRFADRPKLTWFLFVLRAIAVVVLLWILLGPTLVRTDRRFKTKTVAILVDASASMGLVDAADGSGNVTRWSSKAEPGLDEPVAVMRAAQVQLQRFSKISAASKDSDTARSVLSRGVRGIEDAISKLKSDSRRPVLDAVRIIESKVLDTLRKKESEFRGGKSLAALDREQWLPDRLTQLSAAIATLERVAEQAVKDGEAQRKFSGGELQLSRSDKVSAFLAAAEASWLRDIREKATVNRYEFGTRVVPMGAAPFQPNSTARSLADSTQLGGALQQIALDQTAQAVEAAILITDGGHNAGRDPRELAPSLSGAALHVVPIGNTKMQRDVILHHTYAPKAVIQNDTVVIDSIVTAYDCANETVNIELLAGETVIDRQSLPISAEVFDRRVQFRWPAAQLGRHTFSVRVAPVANERTEENNSAKTDLLVMEDKIRVLVADNFPRWETRYLLNLFKRDDRVVFEQLLFEPQPAAGEGARANFPASLEEWSKYRVIILGDVLPNQLTPEHQKQLRQYISEAGGNLIIVAGNDAMPGAFLDQPLGALLPVEAADRAVGDNSAFYLHLGDEASMTLAVQVAENPGTTERVWREMSERLPIYAMSQFSKPKPTTHSLIWASLSKKEFNPAASGTRAFLAWHYIGAGRVVYLAAPVTYQLRYRQGDTFHHRFWGQLLRWTVARDLGEGSRTVRLSTDKSRYEQGEAVQTSVRLRQLDGRPVAGASLHLSAVHEGKVVQEIPLREDAARPGSYNGALEQLPIGPVKLQVSGDRLKNLLALENYQRPIESTINVDPSGMLELRHPLCNLPLLREIADASGGMLVPPTGLPAALKQLNLDPEVLENVSKQPLWNRWDLLALFIGCLALEWSLRKFLGLS